MSYNKLRRLTPLQKYDLLYYLNRINTIFKSWLLYTFPANTGRLRINLSGAIVESILGQSLRGRVRDRFRAMGAPVC